MCALIAAFSTVGAVLAAVVAFALPETQGTALIVAMLLLLFGIFTGVWRIGDLLEKPLPRSPAPADLPSPTIKQMRGK
jgi:hypothetical protein